MHKTTALILLAIQNLIPPVVVIVLWCSSHKFRLSSVARSGMPATSEYVQNSAQDCVCNAKRSSPNLIHSPKFSNKIGWIPQPRQIMKIKLAIMVSYFAQFILHLLNNTSLFYLSWRGAKSHRGTEAPSLDHWYSYSAIPLDSEISQCTFNHLHSTHTTPIVTK